MLATLSWLHMGYGRCKGVLGLGLVVSVWRSYTCSITSVSREATCCCWTLSFCIPHSI